MYEFSVCFWVSHDRNDVQLKTLLKSMKSMEHVMTLIMSVAASIGNITAYVTSLASVELLPVVCSS